MKFGWIKQKPDSRDYKIEQYKITAPKVLPTKTDLRAGCSPIVDQGNLGSCTANAGAGIVDYCEKSEGHPFLDGSRLLLYYNTRVLEGSPTNQDTGATIRGTLKALAKGGICKETTWPYNVKKFSVAPPVKAQNEAINYKALNYVLLDQPGMSGSAVLTAIKTQLAAGLPIEFGFNVYESYSQATKTGCFPYPSKGERLEGGHAVMCVGYEDSKQITNTIDKKTTTGALLIRNSWSTSWGDKGYGYLPYEYIIQGKASDFWVLISEAYK
jgi:C1A family cysteine protease